MLKRGLLIVAVLAVGAFIVAGTGAWSYVQTSARCVKDSVRDAVPVEFQIQRARQMIQGLEPEVRKNMHVIAKEEIEIARLEEKIQKAEERGEKDREQLLTLKSDLTSGRDVFHYAGRSYTKQQVKVDLANRFQRFKTGEATLESLRKICDARKQGLESARQRLEGMLAAKRQLAVEVERLEAQRQMVAAAQTTSNYEFDDSALGRVKELIADLQIRLDTEERLVNAEQYYHDEIPMDEPAPENIVEQVTEYFSQAPATRDVAKD
ncbi:MAG: hypothetical protein JW809_01815 [Pirellulales bacterium]|nr:hypothetical protein [Pirellulales bacterium]